MNPCYELSSRQVKCMVFTYCLSTTTKPKVEIVLYFYRFVFHELASLRLGFIEYMGLYVCPLVVYWFNVVFWAQPFPLTHSLPHYCMDILTTAIILTTKNKLSWQGVKQSRNGCELNNNNWINKHEDMLPNRKP